MAVATLMTASCTRTGPIGPQGPMGNANVIGSDPFTVSVWTVLGGGNYSATFTDPDISSAVYQYGLVQLYKQYSDGSWTNLPDINGGVSTVFNFLQGTFTIYVENSAVYPGTINFRAVIIPSSFRQAHPNANWADYNETMQLLNEAKQKGEIK